MSLQKFKELMAGGSLICPVCGKPIRKYDKFVEMTRSFWDGAGDSNLQTEGSKVTLICGNGVCSWQERTEYWENYLS